MKKIPVSVIIPNYNSGKYLEDCIKSINSSMWPIEILIIDDKSTDQSLEVAIKLESIYSNIQIIKRIKNGGIVEARRTGLKFASQDWISFIDADDFIDSDAILQAYQVAQTEGADICIWDLWRADEEKKWQHIYINADDFPKTGRQAVVETLGSWRIHPLGVARKKNYVSAFENFNYPSQNADELITRIFLSTAQKVSYCNSRYYYRCNQQSSTQTINKKTLTTLSSYIWLLNFAKQYPEASFEIIGTTSISRAWNYYRLRNKIDKTLTMAAISEFVSEFINVTKPYKWLWKYPKHFVALFYLMIVTKSKFT